NQSTPTLGEKRRGRPRRATLVASPDGGMLRRNILLCWTLASSACCTLLLAACSEKHTPIPTQVAPKVRTCGTPVHYPSSSGPAPGQLLGGTAIGDVDGDGRNDVVTFELGYQNLLIFKQSVSGTLTGPTLVKTDLAISAIALGDLNSDGHVDLAVCGRASPIANVGN